VSAGANGEDMPVTPMDAFTSFSDKAIQQIKTFVKQIDEKLLADYDGGGRITINLGKEKPCAGVKEAIEVIFKRVGWTSVVWEISSDKVLMGLIQSYDTNFEQIVNECFPENQSTAEEERTKKKRESKW
jgi:hypothetical protein